MKSNEHAVVAQPDGTPRGPGEPIAIIGLACRLPGAVEEPAALWELLSQGGVGITEIPPDRWDHAALFDPDPEKPGKMYIRHGGFLANIDQFDAAFFNTSRREANQLDPQQRLLLEVSWEAIESAGIAPLSLAGSRTGVFVGISTSDYLQLNVRRNNPELINPYDGTGNAFSVAPGRLSYTLGLHGPSMAVDTACSSSLVSQHLACRSLRDHESDLALAAGVTLILQPDTSLSFSKARMLAADGRCKTFDAAADGYVRGEGCGVVVLKRLSDARRDHDRILAVIRGSAVNHDGRSNGLTAPNGQAQEAVIRAALADAGVQPGDLDYVEAHGTGTPLGDPIEVRALARVFGPGRDPQRPLWLGSIKTNLGHLEAAAGVAGLMKVVLSLGHRQLPAHLHFQRPNPHIDWDQIPVQVVRQLQPWEAQPGRRRLAGVSSFGFGGTNAHLVVEEGEEPPQRQPVEHDRPLHLVTLSARTEGALKELAGRYASHLVQAPGLALADVAYTANTGRSHFGQRLAVVGQDGAEVSQRLARWGQGERVQGVWSGPVEGRPGVAFLFSGQGSQYAGMGQELYSSEPVFRRALDRCAAVLAGVLKEPLLEVMWGNQSQWLEQTGYTQPALFALEYGLAELWRSWGIEPEAVLGHSVGEYVAACVAGVFSLEDGLRLIAERGRLMQGLSGDGQMVAVSAAEDAVREVLEQQGSRVSVAAVNGPKQVVLSGLGQPLGPVVGELERLGIGVQRLRVSHAFHSEQMEGMLEAYGRVAGGVKYEAAKVPLVSNVSGQWLEGPPGGEYWQRHTRQTVHFMSGMKTLAGLGLGVYLELGPQPVLVGLGQGCVDGGQGLWVGSLRRGRGEWEQMLGVLGQMYVSGVEVDWRGFDREHPRRRVPLPTYPFQRQRYWLEETHRRPSVPGESRRGKIHPLLGSRLDVAVADHLYENDLTSADLAYLGDHRICATPILPAAAYLEMALAAAHQLWGDAPVVIEDLEITRTLLAKEGQVWHSQVALRQSPDGSVGFETYACHRATDGEPAAWELHARAKLRKQPAPAEPTPGFQPPAEAGSGAPDYYEQLGRRGLEYGPRFQGIEQFWRRDGEILGRLQLPAALDGQARGYQLHPVLLDSCFQLAGAAILEAAGDDDLFVPVGLRRFARAEPKPSGVAWCHARPAAEDRPGNIPLVWDFLLRDQAGAPVAEISGLQLKRVSRKSWRRLVQPPVEDWLYEIAWREEPLEEASAPSLAGRWLLLSDHVEFGEQLAAALREQGGETQVLLYSLNDVEGFLPPGLMDRSSDYRGVICLAGLNAKADDDSAPGVFEAEQESINRRVLELFQGLAGSGMSKPPPLWLVTRGVLADDKGGRPARLSAAALAGLAKAAALEHPELACCCVDLDPARPDEQVPALCREFSATAREQQVRLRRGLRLVPRLVRSSVETEPGSQVATGQPFRLEIPQRGVLDNLVLAPIERPTPAGGEVEIEVRVAGLNFRDVLNALGMYPGDAGLLGGECAGVITAVGPGMDQFQVGQPVVAIAPGTFASHVVASSVCVWHKPANLSYAEAATIPIAFLTAQYGLAELARLKAGDRVLIHSAAGGVGLAAVQIALRAGAEVYATASPPKWDAVRRHGVTHVLNSRTLEFADEIRALTQGRGVDVVLNSFAGEFIPASLRLLAPGGRFLEIGKRDIWTADQVRAVRPEVSYFPYDLAELLREKPAELNALLRGTLHALEAGDLRPIPATEYPIGTAAAAFRFMAQARHVGKVVLSLQNQGPALRADRTYVITGGLGALGREVTAWLADHGARWLALVGRSAPSEAARHFVAQLERKGASVRLLQADVARYPELAESFARLASDWPPIGGIIHAAGVVDDAPLLKQTWERFAAVLAPKTAAVRNLHLLTRGQPVEFFFLFSSIASVLGSGGQSNYAAANAFLDAFAYHRANLGLPATTINWGPWEEAGMAARLAADKRARWTRLGLQSLTPDRALSLLSVLLLKPRSQIVAIPIDWAEFLRKTPPELVPSVLREIAAGFNPAAAARQDPSAIPPFIEELKRAHPRRRRALLLAHVLGQVRKVLGLTEADALDPQQGLSSLGMDSLMAVELRSRLQTTVGCSLPATMAFEYPNLEAITDYLAKEILEADGPLSAGADSEALPAPAAGETAAPALDDLSEAELARLLDQKLSALGKE